MSQTPAGSRFATLLLLGILLTLPNIPLAQPICGRAVTEVGVPESMPLRRAVALDDKFHQLEPRHNGTLPPAVIPEDFQLVITPEEQRAEREATARLRLQLQEAHQRQQQHPHIPPSGRGGGSSGGWHLY